MQFVWHYNSLLSKVLLYTPCSLSPTSRVSLTTLSVQKTRGEAWETREPRAFFRGRDSNRERLDLVRLHRNETELFDVALTNWFFFTKEYSEEVYGPKAKHVSFHDFFKVMRMGASCYTLVSMSS